MMGRADILLRFLQLAQMDRPKDLEPYTDGLDLSPDAAPLVNQVVDRIISDKPELSELYGKAVDEVRLANPYTAAPHDGINVDSAVGLSTFMHEWIKLEKILEIGSEGLPPQGRIRTMPWSRYAIKGLLDRGVVTQVDVDLLDRLRMLRNEIMHRSPTVDARTLTHAAALTKILREKIEKDGRTPGRSDSLAEQTG
jgi:hypothetical protein